MPRDEPGRSPLAKVAAFTIPPAMSTARGARGPPKRTEPPLPARPVRAQTRRRDAPDPPPCYRRPAARPARARGGAAQLPQLHRSPRRRRRPHPPRRTRLRPPPRPRWRRHRLRNRPGARRTQRRPNGAAAAVKFMMFTVWRRFAQVGRVPGRSAAAKDTTGTKVTKVTRNARGCRPARRHDAAVS